MLHRADIGVQHDATPRLGGRSMGIKILVVAPIYLSIDGRLLPDLFSRTWINDTSEISYDMLKLFFLMSFFPRILEIGFTYHTFVMILKIKMFTYLVTMNKAKSLIYIFQNHAILEEDVKKRMEMKMKCVRRHGDHIS